MKIKHYKVTKDYVLRFFLEMPIEDYYKHYPICERARELNMPVWDFVIMKINEGVFTYRGVHVQLKDIL